MRGILCVVVLTASLTAGSSAGERVAAEVERAGGSATDQPTTTVPTAIREDLAGYGCRELAEDVLSYERAENPDVDDIEVRDLTKQKDLRATFEMPDEGDDTLVLQCRGDGQWMDRHPYPVRFSLWVLPDATFTMDWQPTY